MKLFKKIFQLSIIAYLISIIISCNNFADPGLSVYFPDTSRIEYYREVPSSVASQVDPLNLGSFNAKLWPKDKTIFYIKWYDGDDDIHTKILADFNSAFTPYTGKSFAVTEDIKQADFYISFVQNNQSWSYIGTDCKYIAATGKPTCNLGWAIAYRNNQGGERSGTAIHEIVGHALGYIHTLQSPACVGSLVWNKEFVYAKYARIGWSRAQVDAQVFTTYSAQEISDEACDFKSNMCYPVSPGEANVVVGRNNVQSILDLKKLIADYKTGIIPPPPPPPPAPNGKIISIGVPSTQSSIYGPAYTADKANDGIISPDNFNHTMPEPAPWWQLDFGIRTAISTVKIYSRSGCQACNGRMRNLTLFIDGVQVWQAANNSYFQNGDTISIAVNKFGQTLRIQSFALAGNTNILHLSEVSVYGLSGPVPVCRDSIFYRQVKDSIRVCK